MPKTSLDKSPYSVHFNVLRYMGAWMVRSGDEKYAGIYAAYKVFMTMLAASGCYSLFVDFYLVFGDLKKMSWNLCVTTLFFGGVIKNIICVYNSRILNKLRSDLHNDEQSRNTPEDDAINATALRELRLVRISFYGTTGLFIPVWLITRYISYLWGPREVPLPLRIPIEYDPEDNLQYNYVFAVFTTGGLTGIALVVENEIAMFTILIQISREYIRLLKDIPKINDLFEDYSAQYEPATSKQEVNPHLRHLKAKKLIKDILSRQQKQIEYIEDFEYCYNKTMILQLFAVGLIAIVNSIIVIIQSEDFSVQISYQSAYIFLLMVDLYLVCYLATRLREQCFQVSEQIYSTVWYRMDPQIQKDICMMIMRSQRPPKITSGKIVELNLHAFMLVVRNIYSWLALYKQLDNKIMKS